MFFFVAEDSASPAVHVFCLVLRSLTFYKIINIMNQSSYPRDPKFEEGIAPFVLLATLNIAHFIVLRRKRSV